MPFMLGISRSVRTISLKYPCRVELYTDSTYLRNAFEKGWLERWRRNGWRTSGKQSVLNRDLWEELWELSRTHSIHWHWVKGHAGDERNNRCDALVQRAKEEFLSGMSPAAPA